MADARAASQRYLDAQRRVRLLDRTAVPTPLQVQVRDLTLFDDILAYETTPTTTDPSLAQVAETRLVLTEARVKECAQLFRELWDVSRELSPAH